MTANVLAPFGFTPVRRLDGAAWTANQSQYQIASDNTHNIYQGDLVTLGSSGYIDVTTPGTDTICGIFIGCKYLSTAQGKTVWTNHFPGGDTTTVVTAYVIDDPNVVFLCQSDGASGSAIPITALGANAQASTTTSGNNYNGISGMALSTTVNTTDTLPFKIVGIPGLTDIVSGQPYLTSPANGYDQSSPYNYIWVTLNNQLFKNLTGV